MNPFFVAVGAALLAAISTVNTAKRKGRDGLVVGVLTLMIGLWLGYMIIQALVVILPVQDQDTNTALVMLFVITLIASLLIGFLFTLFMSPGENVVGRSQDGTGRMQPENTERIAALESRVARLEQAMQIDQLASLPANDRPPPLTAKD